MISAAVLPSSHDDYHGPPQTGTSKLQSVSGKTHAVGKTHRDVHGPAITVVQHWSGTPRRVDVTRSIHLKIKQCREVGARIQTILVGDIRHACHQQRAIRKRLRHTMLVGDIGHDWHRQREIRLRHTMILEEIGRYWHQQRKIRNRLTHTMLVGDIGHVWHQQREVRNRPMETICGT